MSVPPSTLQSPSRRSLLRQAGAAAVAATALAAATETAPTSAQAPKAAAAIPPTFETVAPVSRSAAEQSFPPFEIPAQPERREFAAEAAPESTPETSYLVEASIDSQVSEPTAPLNLSQEPPTFAQRIGSTRIPEVVAIVALAVAMFSLISAGLNQWDSLTNPLLSAPTARPTNTAEPTAPPGSTPTGIPTLPQTVAATSAISFTGAQKSATPALTATRAGDIISPTLEIPVET